MVTNIPGEIILYFTKHAAGYKISISSKARFQPMSDCSRKNGYFYFSFSFAGYYFGKACSAVEDVRA